MDGSHSNDGQDSSSSCGMADPRSYDVIPSWEEIFDAPIIHPQQEYQNMKSSQFGDFFQQKRMWVQDSAKNQLRSQHFQNQLQHQKVQSTQYRALRRPRQLLPSMGQDCFKNQLSLQHMQSVQFSALQQQNTMPSTMQVQKTSHNQFRSQNLQNPLQHQNVQGTQHYALCPPGQLNPTESQTSSQHLQHQNLQSMKPCKLGLPIQMLPTDDKDSTINQLSQQHLQHQSLQSTQSYPWCPLGQLPPTEGQISFENQLSPQHLRPQTLLSTQPSAWCPPRHLPSTVRNRISFQNQGEVPQDPVSRQQYQLQTNQQQLQPHVPLYKFPSPPPHTSMSMYSPPPHTSSMSMYSPPQFIILSPKKPRKRVDHKPTELSPAQITKEEMEEFVDIFFMRRHLLDMSQDAVGLVLSRLSLKQVTRHDFSGFERLELHFKTMCEFKLLLEEWLENIETSVRKVYSSVNATESTNLHLKQAISISLNTQHDLEEAFKKNPNPKDMEIKELAKSLNMDKLSVTIWFYDRRQILKRYKPETACSKPLSPLLMTRTYRRLFQAGHLATLFPAPLHIDR